MTIVTTLFDTKLNVYHTVGSTPVVGSYSIYTDEVHPGTTALIKGWQFDKRLWPVGESDYPTTLPFLTNPDLSLIPSENYQSGIGKDDDLHVNSIEYIIKSGFSNHWGPDINHGHYFIYDVENYLYADGYRSLFTSQLLVTESGLNILHLPEYPKVSNPITAHQYIWNYVSGEYEINLDFKKKAHFTGKKDPGGTNTRLSTWDTTRKKILYGNIDQTEPEFIVWYSGNNNLPLLILNSGYTADIGNPVVASGDLFGLEYVGTSDGSDSQQYHILYSPVDRYSDLGVFTWPPAATSWTEWDTIFSGANILTGDQVRVDRDLGILEFGYGGNVPEAGDTVGVFYTSAVAVRYEPENTPDTTLGTEEFSNTNPIKKTVESGFVIIKNSEPQPSSIVLEALLDTISLDFYGPLNIGNTLAPLVVTVSATNGEFIEGATVTISILDDPLIGNLSNGLGSISVVTNDIGEARSSFISPNTVEEISELITASGYTTNGTDTTLTTSILKIVATQRDIYLYKVFKDDPILGMELGDQATLDAGGITTELSEFYRAFFEDESIFGPTGNVYPTTTASTDAPDWEHTHRIVRGLTTPKNYNRSFRNGRKQIVSKYDIEAINPHVEASGAFVPIQPDEITNTAIRTNEMLFEDIVLDPPEVGDLDAYLLVSPTTVRIQASVRNEITNTIIYSNIIEIQLAIPPYMSGTLYLDTLNSIPSGLLTYDLTLLPDDDRILPLGFRIKSPGITFASALGGVTYIDINPKPELSHFIQIVPSGNQ